MTKEPGGIIFLRSENVAATCKFYTQRLGFKLWLDQKSCQILRRNNLILGFCQGEKGPFDGILTLFYSHRSEVDAAYTRLKDLAQGEPQFNEKFQIYQFFAADPEGRTLEFQSFEHPVDFNF